MASFRNSKRYYRSTVDYLATRNFDRATCEVMDQGQKNEDSIEELQQNFMLVNSQLADHQESLNNVAVKLDASGTVSHDISFNGEVEFNGDICVTGNATIKNNLTLQGSMIQPYFVIDSDFNGSLSESSGNVLVLTDNSSIDVQITLPENVPLGYTFNIMRSSLNADVTLKVPTGYKFHDVSGSESLVVSETNLTDSFGLTGDLMGLTIVIGRQDSSTMDCIYYALSAAQYI